MPENAALLEQHMAIEPEDSDKVEQVPSFIFRRYINGGRENLYCPGKL